MRSPDCSIGVPAGLGSPPAASDPCYARVGREPAPRGTHPGSPCKKDRVANVLVLIFAVSLCLVNAAVWTLVSEMPIMGAAWGLAAVACLFMQKWTRG
jgi:hypothetical protein